MTHAFLKTCCHCGTVGDLRPYGPKGSWVCYDCALATPERTAETEAAFNTQFDAAIADGGDVIIGEACGPYAAKHHPEVQKFLDQKRRAQSWPY